MAIVQASHHGEAAVLAAADERHHLHLRRRRLAPPRVGARFVQFLLPVKTLLDSPLLLLLLLDLGRSEVCVGGCARRSRTEQGAADLVGGGRGGRCGESTAAARCVDCGGGVKREVVRARGYRGPETEPNVLENFVAHQKIYRPT